MQRFKPASFKSANFKSKLNTISAVSLLSIVFFNASVSYAQNSAQPNSQNNVQTNAQNQSQNHATQSAQTHDELKIEEFKKIYAQYQQGVQSGRVAGMFSIAQKAYNLGCELFGSESLDCAILGVNFANIADNRNETPLNVIKKVLPTYKREFGENSLQVGQLYALAANKTPLGQPHTFKRNQRKALDIAEYLEAEEPVYAELLRVKVSESYLFRGNKKSRHIVDAVDKLESMLPSNDFSLIEPNFLLGKYYLSYNKPERSTEAFKRVIDIIESSGKPHAYLNASKAFLVESYERAGLTEKATEICLEIGQSTPWQENVEPVPLYRVQPIYPRSLRGDYKEGYARFEFDIDEQGFVTNIKTIDHEGDRKLINASLKAIKQWRYAPKFENGKAVVAEDIKLQMDFSIVR